MIFAASDLRQQTCRHIALRHATDKRGRCFPAHFVRCLPEKSFVLRHQAVYYGLRIAILRYMIIRPHPQSHQVRGLITSFFTKK